MPTQFEPEDRTANRSRSRRALALFLCVGAAVSIAFFLVVFHSENDGADARFQELAVQRIAAVQTNISIAMDTVAMLAGHFDVTQAGQTSREEFVRLASVSLERHAFIQALEWIPRVSRDDRPSIERRMRMDGVEDFAITERNTNGSLSASAEKDEYFPVLYVAPIKGNERAVGFDLGSNPTRLAAINQAREGGGMVSTARITLVQEQGDQYGMLTFAPVFAHRQLGNGEGQRQALVGYALGIFRVGDLINEGSSVATGNQNSTVDVYVYDLSAPEESRQLFPKSPESSLNALTAGLHMGARITVGARDWLVLAVPGKGSRPPLVPINAVIVLLVGILSTIFLAYYQMNGVERAERLARFSREIDWSRQKTEMILASVAEGIYGLNQSGHCTFANPAAVHMVGWKAEEMIGRNQHEIIHHSHADGSPHVITECPIYQTLRDRRTREVLDDVFWRKDGTSFPVEFVVSPLNGIDGSGVVIIFRDITQRRRLETERAMMVERMSEASRLESLGTMAGGVAHEINTPTQYIGDNLAFVRDWIPRLLEVVGAARAAAASGEWSTVAEQATGMKYDFAARELPAAVAQALTGVARISTIVQAIKTFSYPSGTTSQPFDLNHAVDMASTVTRGQWKHAAELNLDLDPTLPPLVAIEGEINQVLVNLIVNAAQAISESGNEQLGRIDVSTRLDEDMIEISVKDTGIGIPKANLSRLFELFFTTKPPGQGTGQGLAITRAIVSRHGGTITVESEPGKGACFRVRLPTSGKAATEACSTEITSREGTAIA